MCSSRKTTWLPVNHSQQVHLGVWAVTCSLWGAKRLLDGMSVNPVGGLKTWMCSFNCIFLSPTPKDSALGGWCREIAFNKHPQEILSMPKRNIISMTADVGILKQDGRWVQEVVGIWGNRFLETHCLFWSFALSWPSCHLSDHSPLLSLISDGAPLGEIKGGGQAGQPLKTSKPLGCPWLH